MAKVEPALTVEKVDSRLGSHSHVEWHRMLSMTSSTAAEEMKAIEAKTLTKRRKRMVMQAKMLIVVALPVVAMISVSGRVLYGAVDQHLRTESARRATGATSAVKTLIARLLVERSISVELLLDPGVMTPPSSCVVKSCAGVTDNRTTSSDPVSSSSSVTPPSGQSSKSSVTPKTTTTTTTTTTTRSSVGQVKQRLTQSRSATDAAFATVSWDSYRSVTVGETVFDSIGSFEEYLSVQRRAVDRYDFDFVLLLATYSEIVAGFIGATQTDRELPDRDEIWPLVVSFDSMLRTIDVVDTQKSLGTVFLRTCRVDAVAAARFWNLDGRILGLVQQTFSYNPNPTSKSLYDEEFEKSGLMATIEAEKSRIFSPHFWEEAAAEGECSETGVWSQVNDSVWNDSMQKYSDLLWRIEAIIEKQSSTILEEVYSSVDGQLVAISVVVVVVTSLCLVLSFWYMVRMHRLVVRMSSFAHSMQMKSVEFTQEKRRTDMLLYKMMPTEVAELLKSRKEVKAQHFDQVSIYFSDVIGFQEISSRSSPMEIIEMLNALYSIFDESIDRYHVYKVETIGDSYIVASGLPIVFPDHGPELARLAVELVDSVEDFVIHHLNEALHLRVGIHTGPVVGAVVGLKMPRYCIFGDTVNTASRMMTSGESRRIHISQTMKWTLEESDEFLIEERGVTNLKGKGEMMTYWLNGFKRQDSITAENNTLSD